ncbi:MAG: DUF4136 domain-containing protein [Candidatus Binatia bacterium]|nr:DUF4136 domain-containing protein [Candidatus Binatia bacterium]
MKLRSFATALAVLLTMAACSPSITIQSDFNPEVDFSKLRSFAWLPIMPAPTGDRRADSSILAGRVRRATIADLKGKGFKEVLPTAQPDFYVAYQAAVDDKLSVRSTPTHYGYNGWWGPSMMGTQTTVHQYELGTLIIDIVDRERDDLVWRGSGQAKMQKQDTRTSAERDKDMTKAVQEILKNFPPTASR